LRVIGIVDKGHAVPDEDVVFDLHALANKGWLEILQRLPTLAFFWISTKAPIFVSSPISQPLQINELGEPHVLAEPYAWWIETNSFTG